MNKMFDQIAMIGIVLGLLLVILNPVSSSPLIDVLGSRVQPNFMSQDPAPADAGKDVDLRWQVFNTVPGTMDLKFHLDAEYPFLFEAGDSPDKNLGASTGTSDSNWFYVLHYKLRIANNAPKGKYNITLNWNTGSGWEKKDFQIFVEGLPILSVSKTSGNIMTPGKITEMSMTLLNSGTAVAEDTVVEAENIIDSTTGTPLYSLIGSGTRFYVGNIEPGNVANITFNILINEKAKEGAYNLPLDIHTKNINVTREYIGISIISKVAITDIRTDPEEIIPGKIATLKVKVKNFGNNDVNSVRIRVLENELFREKTGTYLGTIKPDDEKTALFEINVISNSSNNIPIELLISYRDGNGEHSYIEKTNILLVSAVESNQPLVQQMSIISILLILIGVVVIRFYKKNKPFH